MSKIALIAALIMANTAVAQVGDTFKEAGEATAETAKQVGHEVKGAVSPEPKRSLERSKARIHQAKARQHARAAKKAAANIVQSHRTDSESR